MISLRQTALHEAGHCVAALVAGDVVTAVNIKDDFENKRHGVVLCSHAVDNPAYRWLVKLAGPVAQTWAGCSDGYGCGSDFAGIDEIIGTIEKDMGIGVLPWSEVKQVEAAMTETINRMRPHIETLADELVKRTAMTGDEIVELLGWQEAVKEWQAEAA